MVLVCGNYTKVYNCINNNKKKHKTKSYMKIFIHGMKKLTEYKCITEFYFGKQIKPLDVML